MKSSRHIVVFLAVLFFAGVTFSSQASEDRGLWMGIEVGCPFYNMVMEATDEEVATWGSAPFFSSIRRAKRDLGLTTGDQFAVNFDTGEIQPLLQLAPDLLGELKETGLFFLDVTLDSVVVLPLDVIKDLRLSLQPWETPEDRTLNNLELLARQFQNIATDLRSAVGISGHNFEESGLVKIVISAMSLSPSGVLEGSWDVVAGVFGATEDAAFTTVKIVRRGVLSFVNAIKNLFDWW